MTQIKKYLSTDQTIRIAAVISTDLVAEATAKQKLGPLAATLVGRAMTGAILMASQMKEEQRLGLHFQGDGVINNIFAEASYEGAARAYCDHKQAELPAGASRIGEGLGQGRLDVIRTLPFQKDPYRGTVELYSGEVGDDIAFYLNQSQQIPAIVALTAIPDHEAYELCGGYIVELMPGATDATIEKLESIQQSMIQISKLIRAGATVEDLIAPILAAFDFEEIAHPYSFYHQCVCSVDRMERALTVLGLEAVLDILAKNEEPVATCEFCGTQYQISTEQLQQILMDLQAQTH
ncbi:MAG: Hsp33 family molecular chaperone HslO [Oligoflexus sp.]